MPADESAHPEAVLTMSGLFAGVSSGSVPTDAVLLLPSVELVSTSEMVERLRQMEKPVAVVGTVVYGSLGIGVWRIPGRALGSQLADSFSASATGLDATQAAPVDARFLLSVPFGSRHTFLIKPSSLDRWENEYRILGVDLTVIERRIPGCPNVVGVIEFTRSEGRLWPRT